MLRIQLLGPLRAWRGGNELALGGQQQRAVMGLLVAHAAAGTVMSSSDLIDAIWAERAPASGPNIIQTYLKRLRRLLEPDREPHAPSRFFRRVARGHTLHLSHVELDLAAFRRLVDHAAEAERAGDQRHAAHRLGEALQMWTGAPLADVPLIAGHPAVVALSAERWVAVARYGEAMLAIGQAREALPILEQAVAAGRLDEAAHSRLIRAYQATGNRAKAFDTYHAIRRRLSEELGVDPGSDLAEAHLSLLRNDSDPPTRTAGATATTATRPAQLPMAAPGFVGRGGQLRQLDLLLSAQEPERAVVISAISGTAGIGKTALATHWAHRVADQFPDGQLFVNLRGFDPTGSAMPPAEAIRGFLDALHVPPDRIPAGLEAQVGLYRSLLSGRRMLILLDNARDSDQVRPLLPGSSGSFVLITSRNQLIGLIAADGAQPLAVDPLSDAEARELIAYRLGAGQTTADPAAFDEIIARCAGLPLALALIAARVAVRSRLDLVSMVHELRNGLDAFATGDGASDLRAVLSYSYRALSPEAQRLFRLLAVHPGPDIGLPAAASLAGVPAAQVRSLLTELSRANLLSEPAPGRYAFHDLLRTYATELARTVHSDDGWRAAQQRVLGHYLHTAHAADRTFGPRRDLASLGPPRAGTTLELLADHEQALAWFSSEHAVLLACITQGVGAGLDIVVWQLVWTIERYLDLRGHWDDQATVQGIALAAARRLGDQRLQAHFHRGLAVASAQLGRIEEARLQYELAGRLFADIDDTVGRAQTHHNVALLLGKQDRRREALAHHQVSLDLYRSAGHRAGEAHCLNGIGWNYAMLGDHRLALRHCQQALAVLADLGEHHVEGIVWDSVGYAHHHLGNHQQAVDCYQRALAVFRTFRDRHREAEVLTHLGEAHHSRGNTDRAVTAWRAALAVLEKLDHPDAEQVRTKLRGLVGSRHGLRRADRPASRPPRPPGRSARRDAVP